MRFFHDKDWVQATLHLFEDPRAYLRMVIQLNNFAYDHSGL